MALQPETCRLFILDLYRNYSAADLPPIEIPMEDNWILFIILKDVEALNLDSDAAANVVAYFVSSADIPLKILMQVRNHLMSYCSHRTPEDIAMDRLISYTACTDINLNYNIATAYINSGNQSIYTFYKCINRAIREGVCRSIENDGRALESLIVAHEQKKCTVIVNRISENYSAVDLFTMEIPVDDWKFRIEVKWDEALTFYSDSCESQVCFHVSAAMPIKILMKIRNNLMSRCNAASDQDRFLDRFTDIINNLNDIIPVMCNCYYCFLNLRDFRKWINKILLNGIPRSISDASNA